MAKGIFRLAVISFIFYFSNVSMSFAEDYESSYSKTKSKAPSLSVGLASNSHLLYSNETGFTLLYGLSNKGAIQAFLLMAGSDPNRYSIAGSYKHTISGNKSTGFHVGGGLGLGNYADGKSFMHIAGIAGFHFRVARRVLIHIDGGLTLTNDDEPGNSTESDSQIVISGHSSLFGTSLLYSF